MKIFKHHYLRLNEDELYMLKHMVDRTVGTIDIMATHKPDTLPEYARFYGLNKLQSLRAKIISQ